MGTATSTRCTEQIGETAGRIWHYLNDHGPTSLTRLMKEVDAPRDLLMQGVGWLAREDKVEIEEKNRARTIRLK